MFEIPEGTPQNSLSIGSIKFPEVKTIIQANGMQRIGNHVYYNGNHVLSFIGVTKPNSIEIIDMMIAAVNEQRERTLYKRIDPFSVMPEFMWETNPTKEKQSFLRWLFGRRI